MSKQNGKPTIKQLEARISELKATVDLQSQIIERINDAVFGAPQKNLIGLVAAYDNVDNRSLALYRFLNKKDQISEEEFLAEYNAIQEEAAEMRREAPFRKLGFEKVEGATIDAGDLVIFGSSASLDGQKFTGSKVENAIMVIGSQEPVAGFGDKFKGAKEGDNIDFMLTIPEDYPMEEIAGKLVRYQCEIRTVRKPMKKQELPVVEAEQTESK